MCVREHLLCVHDLPYDVLPHLFPLKSFHLLFFLAFVLPFNACHPGNLYKPVKHPNEKIEQKKLYISELAFSDVCPNYRSFYPCQKQTNKQKLFYCNVALDACPVQVYYPGSPPKIWIHHMALPPVVTLLCFFCSCCLLIFTPLLSFSSVFFFFLWRYHFLCCHQNELVWSQNTLKDVWFGPVSEEC